MIIGVDAQRLAGQPLGVGRYLEYLVKYWSRMLNGGDRMHLYVRHEVEPGRLELSEAIDVRVLRPKLSAVTWQSLVLSREAPRLDVLYGPSYATPLWYRGRSVVAIHSMNEVQPGSHPWWYDLTYSRIYRRSAVRAQKVIVPAEATRQDLMRHYGIAVDKIVVVPQGAPETFRPVEDGHVLKDVRRRYFGQDRPYVLFVGKLSQRRNIPSLMRAFALLKKTRRIPHGLLLVGPNHLRLPIEELARELEIADCFVQTDGRFAEHRELVPIYSAADVFVHASSYEGFSMTIVEALACGVPVVTVDRPALREVVDRSALLVQEPTPEALAEAIGQVIGDDAVRRELSERSLARSKRFTWERCARETLDVLREVGGA